MNDDEEKTVAVAAAKCAERADLDRWGLIMRYGRLFTAHPQPGRGPFPDRPAPDNIARNAYQRAMDLGLLYAEGYVSAPGFLKFSGLITTQWAWCLDGESVVDPELSVPGTAYFGVAVRPGYARRVYEARQRYREGPEEHTWIFAGGYEAINPPLDPAADLVSDLGRDIDPAVRERALAAIPDKVPLTGPYARFVIRRVSWNETGMALVCNGPGGAFTDDAHILGVIQDGDSVATLTRMADEHRAQCERETPVAGDETGKPAWTPAEARLQSAGRTFAVLRRLDYNVWDAWLRPPTSGGEAAGVRVTRNAVSYEMAFVAVFRAMGAAMPTHFTTLYVGEQPDPPAYPAPFVPTYDVWAPLESRLPMSYERHMIRAYGGGHGMTLFESGQTGGIHGRDGSPLAGIGDGTSLAELIQVADEKRTVSEWTSCPEDERRNPELTVQKNAEVDLCWGQGGEAFFAALHRLADGTWDAWLTPSHVPVSGWEEPTELLTPAGVSYEMALAAVARAMGEDMPTGFGLNYLDTRITPGLPGPAQV